MFAHGEAAHPIFGTARCVKNRLRQSPLVIPDSSSPASAHGASGNLAREALTGAETMTELAQSLIDALSLGGLYALIAIGVTLIYTVMGMMNFAQGEFIMLPAYALYVLAGLPFAVAVGRRLR